MTVHVYRELSTGEPQPATDDANEPEAEDEPAPEPQSGPPSPELEPTNDNVPVKDLPATGTE